MGSEDGVVGCIGEGKVSGRPLGLDPWNKE